MYKTSPMNNKWMLAALLLAAACAPREAIPEAPDYASAESWYVTDRGADVDLFYISSTETFDAAAGRKVFHYAQAADSAACPGMRGEMEGVDRILAGDLNFYSPFYRQMSMETYQDMDLIDSRFPLAMDDVRRAFKYYVEELSDGRPFVLAGFSQGGEVLVELLKELPDSLQDRLVAAYVLGWKITPEDLAASTAIRPAQGADDTGVTICYNSVDSPENASFVSSGNTVAINPVNWCTDATPAVLFDSLTVTLDPETKLLLVDGFEGTGYAWKPYFKDGCYHTFEIRWYGESLRENIAERCEAYQVSHTSGNPLFEGWYADPEAVVFDKEYWIYPTYSHPYEEQLFMDAFSSKDLVHWTKHDRVLAKDNISWLWRALWAPSVVRKEGRYYLYFGANDMHEKGEGGIGVAVADNPAGPFKDALGHPLIDEVVNGAQPIDQFVFLDDDGTYYMYYGGWGHCNLVRLGDDLMSLVPFEDGSIYKEVTPQGYVEGPFMLKRNGTYYFMWSEGGWTGPDYHVAYARADSPFGPFKREGTILESDPDVATGAGHHSVIRGRGEDEYYIVYHRHPLGATDGNNRVVCIERLHFDETGRILPVRITFEGVPASRL